MMPLPSDSAPTEEVLPLPPGQRLVAELASGPGTRVVHARSGEREVVVRLEVSGAGVERAAELAVLGKIEHRGLAGLVDFGSLDAGRVRFVAREFVEGRDLREWARGRAAEEIAALVVKLGPALDHLHARGFLHGDLKAENVIVTPDDRPVLTDFGLARVAGEARATAGGSLFHVAPEVLLGREAGPRADLFSLGVLLHELLAGRRATAREFYALFPAQPFFEAVGGGVAELPDFARELVSALLQRDPARRPASAGEVERTMYARLGIEGGEISAVEAPVRIELPLLFGRASFVGDWLREAPAAWAFAFHEGESARSLFEELRFQLALEGRDAWVVPLGEEAAGHGSDGELDALATRWIERAGGNLLLLAVPEDDVRAARCAEFIVRGAAAGSVVRSVGAGEVCDETLWTRREVPRIERAELAELLEREIEGDTRAFADWLDAHCEGSRARIAAAFERAAERGWLVAGALRPRLLTLPDEALELDEPAITDALAGCGDDALRLAHALRVAGEGGTLDELRELAAMPAEHAALAFEELVAARAVRVVQRGEERRVEARALKLPSVPEETLRALHARRARALRDAGAGSEDVLPHELRAEPGPERLEALLEEACRLRERGEFARALTLVRRATSFEEERGDEIATELVGELAIAWAALGFPERTAQPVAELERRGTDEARALAETSRGWAALGRREVARASEHFEQAAALSQRNGAPVWDHALTLYQRNQLEELEELFVKLDAGEYANLSERYLWNLEMIRELAMFRAGDTTEARARLEARLDGALASGEEEREASVLLNLGTLERRTGELESAARRFQRAADLYRRSGFLAGLAQAYALGGGCLRELGELHSSHEVLRRALSLRERLGDVSGAQAVRGMLGLLHADRGCLRAGLDELRASARGLREVKRRADAIVLESRCRVLAARLGEDPGGSAAHETEREAEGDPRGLVDLARTAWLRGKLVDARDLAERARDFAAKLGLEASRDEAALLLHWLVRLQDGAADAPELTSPRAREDHELLERLAAPTGAFETERALALAVRLKSRGCEDRAARLAMAIIARANESERALARRATAILQDSAAVCESGLTVEQTACAQHTLLGLPDPWPSDIELGLSQRNEEELEDMALHSILDINHELAAQESEQKLLGAIVENALRLTQAERGFLVLEEDGELRIDSWSASERGKMEDPEREYSHSVVRRALRENAAILSSNAIDDPLLGGARSIEELDLRSILCVPFEVSKKLRGAIYVDHRIREGAFGESAKKQLSYLADQAVISIRQRRNLDEIRRLNSELKGRVVAREAELEAKNRALAEAGVTAPPSGLIGSSAVMARVRKLIERCAPTEMSVLVVGESGTGKELVARALHEVSPRKELPSITENCAALPPTLIEAELFGAKKGAYTGADRDRPGMFERAQGGTIFLDEIGELPLELQSKLLRVLETGEVRRLGDSEVRSLDFRLVTATNRDLQREVQEGNFRADLLFRLDALRIELPSLAARRSDIPELVAWFLALEKAKSGVARSVSPAVLERLEKRPWPGNVRELANEIARLCVLSEGDLDQPELVRSSGFAPSGRVPAVRMDELERLAIQQALETFGGDKRRAAEELGISRAKIYQRLKEWRQG